jgi:integrase
MRKHHAKNERIKRRYLTYLEEAKRMAPSTVDQVAAAISLFEASTRYKDFALFRIEQARHFKRELDEAKHEKTGKPLAKATIHSRLMALKAFFHWLAGEPGYKSKIRYADSEYFNPSANDSRIATARRERPAPDLAQVKHVLAQMPHETTLQMRDRALVAFAILTGARDDAIASLAIRDIDLEGRKVFQDARTVRTKNRKTFTSWFFPVGAEIEANVAEWIEHLKTDCLFGADDPLFPATKVGQNADQHFAALGLDRKAWSNADPIRRIFKAAFEAAGLPYFNPHSLRKTLARLGETICITPEDFKAWSQNLGHEQVLTTFTSYGSVATHRQAEIIIGLSTRSDRMRESGVPTPETVQRVLDHLRKQT